MDVNYALLNGATLAYLGDAIFEVHIREYLLQEGITHPNQLQKAAVRYVSATGQAKVMQHWLKEDVLDEVEISYYKRGRNHKANTKAKNASIGDYRQATGFESLMAYLYLAKQTNRLNELIHAAIEYLNREE
ncbi:ribonuclease III [Suicoccus acidiformans]|uniref:Mini-ribonuclease 3 n=1 Tax=Suicoccus acidiformans TaxID=2036206 RepID=A0A347WNK1_9LACT|nr:ribonuclease III domain-containing protein [Suicoccus acidiformans]AXY26658.1 ribonuclease III [Suicoccus acidiformans]